MTAKSHTVLKKLNRKRRYIIRTTAVVYVETRVTAASSHAAREAALKGEVQHWQGEDGQRFLPREVDINADKLEVSLVK